MYLYEGMQPVKNVGNDIKIIAICKEDLRPYLSPKYPNTIPPNGRAMNPTAKREYKEMIADAPGPDGNIVSDISSDQNPSSAKS